MEIDDVRLSDSSRFSSHSGVSTFTLVILNNLCAYTVITASPVADIQVTSLDPSALYGSYTNFAEVLPPGATSCPLTYSATATYLTSTHMITTLSVS